MSKTLFDKLKELKIPYAICVGEQSLKNKALEQTSKDWFIIIHTKFRHKFKDSRFIKLDQYHHVIGRTLMIKHIKTFKNSIDEYNLVSSSNDGRVYELKTMPFKTHYDSVPPGVDFL